MTRPSTIFIVTCQLLALPILSTRSEDVNILDMASSLLQTLGDTNNGAGDGLGNLGTILGSVMQGDAGKNLGTILGSLMQGGEDGGKSNKINNMDIITSVLSKGWEDMQGGDGNVAAKMLAGLGGILGGGAGGGQNGQFDPSIVMSMLSMFTQTANSHQPTREKREQPSTNNLDNMLNMASSFLDKKNMAGFLPIIMNAVNAFSGSQMQKRSLDHEGHASFLPPFVEKAHLYWDAFINSEMGQIVWEKAGLKKAFKAFTGPDGKLNFELMFKNFENTSFRRHWIKTAAKYLTDLLVHFSDPQQYRKYLMTGEFVVNTILEGQGIPKKYHVNIQKPEKSLTTLINYSLKKYVQLDTDVSVYVKQAVSYFKQLGTLATAKTDYGALADKITDTLNLEVIEPVLRVYRAYKHSIEAPQCQEHLMCLVNRHHDMDGEGLPGFKRSLTKISSLVASAALSFQNGKGFWDLYNAIQNDVNCESKYPANCAAFHEHEQKVTTEIYHTEL